jgi:Endoribonuclease L-PSP
MGEVNSIKCLGAALLMAGMVMHGGTIAAQEVKHLNPVIEKLAAGKAIIGFQTGDLTLGNARTMSRADADYVYVDMEHTPLDFPGLNQFAMGMVDKATALKKRSPAPNMVLFARFPGGVAEQTAEILSIIDGYLAKAGTDKTKLLRATIWLSDIRTVDDMNKAWEAWVPAGCAPARACVEALLQGPEKKVEIQVTATR